MARKIYPSDKHEQFMVRLPEGIRDQIKVLAETNRRSMNQEVVNIIMDALNKKEEPANHTGRGSDQIKIWSPDGLKGKLKYAASINKRSLNAEIVHRLLASFEAE